MNAEASKPSRLARVGAVSTVVALAIVGLLAGTIVQLVVTSIASAFDPPAALRLAVAQAGFALALAFTAFGYVVVTRRPLGYFDVRFGRRDALWAGGGLLAVFVVLAATGVLADALGVSDATHSTVTAIHQAPWLGLLLVPVSLLFVGPGEELLMRNVVQKRLYAVFSRRGAIVIASLVFTLVHLPAYATPGATTLALSVTLARLCCVALVLGIVYERTDSVVAAALTHGSYDAIQFGALFVLAAL